MNYHSLRHIWLAFLCFFLAACAPHSPRQVQQVKKYPVMLVHDMANKYPWGKDFLRECLAIWGSGRVYAVYIGKMTRTWKREMNGSQMVCGGENDASAGIDFIEKQAEYMHNIIKKLQSDQALASKFSIIAHGMGGLVSRCYIDQHPNTVTDLITIGTPHHGSPLGESPVWSGLYFGTQKVVEDLRPEKAAQFNRKYPIDGAPLADNGKIYTIRGDADGWDVFGISGELQLGWEILRLAAFTDSDGMVPSDSAVIDGATHIGDFNGDDHYELIRKPAVAERAAHYLR